MNTKPINVCYLTYDGLTDPLGQSQILPYLQGLSKAGYQITIISFEKPERFESLHLTISAIVKAASITWIPFFYSKRPPVLSTVYDLLRLRFKVKALHRQQAFQLIHCRSYLTALIGLHMKRKMNVPFLFDMRGFWADERIDGGIWKLSNPVYRYIYNFFKKQERAFFETADHVVSLTESGKNEILSWTNLKVKPSIEVIPCCVDTNLFDEKQLNKEKLQALKHSLQPTDAPLLSYIGSIGTWYLLTEMLEFFRLFLVRYPKANFVFVTPEPPELVYKESDALGIDRERLIICFANRKEVPYYIAACTYSLFFIKQAYSKLASSPTKQGEIMALGKSLICNAGVGDTASIVEKYKAGYVLQGFSEPEMTATIDAIVAAKDSFDPQEIRNGAIAFYGLAEGIRKYQYLYEKLTAGK